MRAESVGQLSHEYILRAHGWDVTIYLVPPKKVDQAMRDATTHLAVYAYLHVGEIPGWTWKILLRLKEAMAEEEAYTHRYGK